MPCPVTGATRPEGQFSSVEPGEAMAVKATANRAARNANRRRFDRRDTAIPATLEYAGGSFEGKVDNLSLNGCLFNPAPAIPPGTRVRIYVRSRQEWMAGQVVMTTERGLHCRLNVATGKLAHLSTELDDMALLLLSAARELPSAARPAGGPGPQGGNTAAAAKRPPAKKSAAKKAGAKKTAVKKAAVKKPAKKKPAVKKPALKKTAAKKAPAKKMPAGKTAGKAAGRRRA